MLPGSELLARGDNLTANVEIRQPIEGEPQGPDGGLGSWQLVATRELAAGEPLVMDSGMSDLELLARGWRPLASNALGPFVHTDLGQVVAATLEA